MSAEERRFKRRLHHANRRGLPSPRGRISLAVELRSLIQKPYDSTRSLWLINLSSDPYRENVEKIEHFPSQQQYRNQHDHNRQQLPEAQPTTRGFEASGGQTQNVQGGKTENHSPQNVVDILPGAANKYGGRNANDRGSVTAPKRVDDESSARRPGDPCHE